MINFLLLGETLQGLTGGAQRGQPVLLHEVLAHRRLYPALTGNSGKHTGLVVGQLLIKLGVADAPFLQQSVNRQIDVLTVELANQGTHTVDGEFPVHTMSDRQQANIGNGNPRPSSPVPVL